MGVRSGDKGALAPPLAGAVKTSYGDHFESDN